jgi:23S rRNA (adenine1618-N6)-methyltransferase
MESNLNTSKEQQKLHHRNIHVGRYDFEVLTKSFSELTPFVFVNKYGNKTIDFANPVAVKLLNKAILIQFYGIKFWDIPDTYLCPPIPGRADYIHYLADLLAESFDNKIPKGKHIKCLDIGIGANCIYPIIGVQEYGWSFVGSDIDLVAINNAQAIIKFNDSLKNHIECRLQTNKNHFFKNIIQPNEKFHLTICNPPFHSSESSANEASLRKIKNLTGQNVKNVKLNFGGQHNELWYEGGEVKFIKSMIAESVSYAKTCMWFTSLVSKKDSLPSIYNDLKYHNALEVKTIEMAQGQKVSRFVAWTFLDKKEQQTWVAARPL